MRAATSRIHRPHGTTVVGPTTSIFATASRTAIATYYQVRGDSRNNDRFPSGIFSPRDDRRDGSVTRRSGGGYQEPAFARGYSDGYQDGLNDARDRNRYDPVGEKDYRSADKGYYGGYGSKDAYKNNYRSGFRQGYEDGYREDGVRRR